LKPVYVNQALTRGPKGPTIEPMKHTFAIKLPNPDALPVYVWAVVDAAGRECGRYELRSDALDACGFSAELRAKRVPA
jgi:hypothetical protein